MTGRHNSLQLPAFVVVLFVIWFGAKFVCPLGHEWVAAAGAGVLTVGFMIGNRLQ